MKIWSVQIGPDYHDDTHLGTHDDCLAYAKKLLKNHPDAEVRIAQIEDENGMSTYTYEIEKVTEPADETEDDPIKYYVIETENVGPNSDEHLDEHTFGISTKPATTNQSHEPRINGWCGTTNDWSVDAHGEFDSYVDALDKIRELTKNEGFRDDPDFSQDDDESIVARFIAGSKPRLNAEQTADYFYSGIRELVRADMTDEEVEAFIEEQIEAAESEPSLPDVNTLRGMVHEIVGELREEQE